MKNKNQYGRRKAISYKFMSIDQIKLFVQHLKFAIREKKLYFTFTRTNDLEKILKILQEAHFIAGYTKETGTDNKVSVKAGEDYFKIFLNYDMQGVCVIQEIQTVSSLRQRIIVNKKQIRTYLNDYPYALALVRTRIGIMNIKECWENGVGGELIAYIK